jgi:hypothetical protein
LIGSRHSSLRKIRPDGKEASRRLKLSDAFHPDTLSIVAQTGARFPVPASRGIRQSIAAEGRGVRKNG